MSKFLSYEERLSIASGLKENLSFGQIGKILEKDRTTIAKEIKKHSYERKSGSPGWSYNACRHRAYCKSAGICGKDCHRRATAYCKLCPSCNDKCPDFIEEICRTRFKPPYVCNGCVQLSKCTLKKYIYDAADAHIAFSEQLSEARSGILANEKELQRMNKLITPLIKNGQSVHQVYIHYVNELMCSEKTLYNYIDASLFDIRNIDLPTKVKRRPHYKKPEFKVDKGCRIGRTYEDYKAFIVKNPDLPVVQMDTVIGEKGGKVLLTIHFVESSLMLAFIREANTSQSVIDIIEGLYKILGDKEFKRLFPVILTDNGSEFSNPKELEFGKSLTRRTNVFYCDPSCPYQKGAIEVNHELIRRILSKGTSFDNLAQEDIFLMMNHINSYKRKKLNNRTPYEAFSFYHEESILHQLCCTPVPAEDIILKSKLLKK